MRILYESDLAGSRYHGMAYRIFQFSSEFKKRGHEVMIVAASFSHVRRVNPIVSKVLTDEIIDGIEYKWIKTPKYKGNGIGRVIHMLVYNFRLWYFAKRIAKEFKPDVVISSGVSPLDFIGCNRIAKKANAKILLEIGDLWPLSPIELGGYSPKHPFIRFLQHIEDYSYCHTDNVISLLPCAKRYMELHGLNEGKFNYIPNGIVLSDWDNGDELPSIHKEALDKLRNDGAFIVGYAGAHGHANSLKTIIDAFFKLQNENVVLVLVGSGQEKDNLIKYVNDLGLINVVFLPSLNKSEIPELLEFMDVLYIGLQKQSLFRFGISPNKIFDYMMAAKPIIQAIDAGNNLVKEADCGVYAQPENPEAIASAILHLKSLSPEERKRLGNNGREFVIKNHSYDVLTDKFLNVIDQTINN